ncbi:MAG: glycosyltransferase [Gemmatimonadetes bacterium]|nr:glycosyltransferase family 4 protein [Gemmatimonadota bacterium]NNM06700.1 glycosyltransferase [Gemmatimonadota bacterium]
MKTSPTPPGKALICAPLPPEYDRESGSRRIFHMIEFLLEAGWTVAFVCENAPPDSRHLRLLRQRGVATLVGFDGPFADLVEGGDFDLAVFAFWYIADRYADVVRRVSPRTRIVVESVDLHWLRGARQILGGRNGEQGSLDADYGGDLVAELNAYAKADAVFTVSEKEAGLVNDIVGDPALALSVPDCDETPRSTVPFKDRQGVLFVGNFRHTPNVDAIQFLSEEILPLLPSRIRSKHPLWIVGNGLEDPITDLVQGCPGIRIVGWVPFVEPYLHQARASIVPLRFGAGTKRKLIQSLLAGTPSVTTPIGIEGMEVTDGKHLLVGDDARSLAEAIERLLTDEELWSALASAGRRRMLRYHSRSGARARFLEAIQLLLSRPSKTQEAVSDLDTGGREHREVELSAFRRAVERAIPNDTSALVVSKGDPELIDIPIRRARHFPLADNGGYAGYHPKDSRAAVHHLSEAREDAEYLVLPPSSWWWLDYYEGFAHHLGSRHERVWADDACVIYRLHPRSSPGVKAVPAAAGSPKVHASPGGMVSRTPR